MSILQSLFGGIGGRSARQRDALIDLLLMAAHADGEASLTDFDRIARAIETNEELRGYDWDEVLARHGRVKKDAPLFAETRESVAKALSDRSIGRFGLGLAVRCCGTPLAEEERALLHQLADLFKLSESDRASILTPWTSADPFGLGYLRSVFNDPQASQKITWIEALARAQTDTELALLTFKATATRVAMSRLSETTELVAIGELIDLDGESLRIDAYLRAGEKTWLARFLAKGEALFPREHALLPQLLDRMESSVSIYIGYQESLPPPDEAALRRIAPERLLSEKL